MKKGNNIKDLLTKNKRGTKWLAEELKALAGDDKRIAVSRQTIGSWVSQKTQPNSLQVPFIALAFKVEPNDVVVWPIEKQLR